MCQNHGFQLLYTDYSLVVNLLYFVKLLDLQAIPGVGIYSDVASSGSCRIQHEGVPCHKEDQKEVVVGFVLVSFISHSISAPLQ